jgi:hypothetical protein
MGKMVRNPKAKPAKPLVKNPDAKNRKPVKYVNRDEYIRKRAEAKKKKKQKKPKNQVNSSFN